METFDPNNNSHVHPIFCTCCDPTCMVEVRQRMTLVQELHQKYNVLKQRLYTGVIDNDTYQREIFKQGVSIITYENFGDQIDEIWSLIES